MKYSLVILSLLLITGVGAHTDNHEAHANTTEDNLTQQDGFASLSEYYPSEGSAVVIIEFILVAALGFVAVRHYLRNGEE
jgi:hypothetical protein